MVRGKPLEIWGGIPGEPAEVRIAYEGQNRTYGSWYGSPRPDPRRVEPPCPRFHLCGGCAIMHLNEQGQADTRADLVRAALDREGLGDVEIGPLRPNPDGLEDFRWVVKLGVGVSDQGLLRLGAWGRRTRTIVPIPKCNVAAPPLRKLMSSIAYHAREFNLWPYEPETDRGVLRSVILRGSRTTGEVLVTIVAGRRPRVMDEFAAAIGENSDVVGVAVHINTEPGNAIYARDEDGEIRFRMLGGRKYIDETLNGISYRIGPGDFFQTNPGMAEVMYKETLDALPLEEGVPFLDLYCGVGGFALPAAKRTKWALGVEEIEGAVQSARTSAKRNDVTAEFVTGRAETMMDDLVRRLGGSRPVITVNPARRGLDPGVGRGLLALKPRAVAYVSCNPVALARDLVEFRAAGMTIGPVALYDMFPNTPHVEAVVVVRSTDAEAPTRRAPRRKTVGRRRG